MVFGKQWQCVAQKNKLWLCCWLSSFRGIFLTIKKKSLDFSYKHICHAYTQRHRLKPKQFQLNGLSRTWSWNRHFVDILQKVRVWHQSYIENLGLAQHCHTCLCWCLTWCECFVIKKGDRPFIRHSCPFSPQWGLSYRSLSSPEP